MIIRRATYKDRPALAKLFKELYNEIPPSTSSSVILLAEEDNKIVGFLVCQQLVHIEPLWIAESHRQAMLLPRLVSEMRTFLPDLEYAFCQTSNNKVAKLLQRLNFKEMTGWRVFRWLRRQDG